MNDQLEMFPPATFPATPNAIGSPELAAGASPSGSPDGQTTGQSGQAPVHASHSAQPGKKQVSATTATCGQSYTGSPESAALQRCLESRLHRLTDMRGSTLFALTWKQQATPSGRLFCLLRASGRRMDDTGFSSWPTPKARDGHREGVGKFSPSLATVATLCAWPTPCAQDGPSGGPSQLDRLPGVAALCAWQTPTSPADGHQAGNNRYVTSVTDALSPWSAPRANKRGFPDSHGSDERPADIGLMPIGYRARAESGGPLNPDHSRWLMGFPVEWASCAPTETLSFLKRARPSSERS